MLGPRQEASPPSESSGWATFIGIVICLCGNVVISFALNIQRLAHERIQRKLHHHQQHHPASFPSTTTAQTPKPSSSGDDGIDEGGAYYLRSKLWWTGLVLMAIGETGNFVAYGFAPASIVAPLGTVAILCNALIAPLVFHERFRLRDFTGIVLSTAGAVTIVLSAKTQEEKLSPDDILRAITEMPFEIYFTVNCVIAVILVYLSRRVGERSITIDLGLVAIFVLSTKGIASLLSMSLYRVFTFPISYLLLFVLITTAVLQVKYLNKALARFSSTQVIPTQFVMFTLSVVLGSSILYKDFNSATPARVLKFTFGCIATFIGVYLITSKRPPRTQPRIPSHDHHHHHGRRLHNGPPTSPNVETTPLLIVPSSPPEPLGLGETPPQFLGTSFGYHFTNPRVLERKGSRSTLPRRGAAAKEGDLAATIWARWRGSDGETTVGGPGTGTVRSERMGRTQSDVAVTAEANGRMVVAGEEGVNDTQSEIVDPRGSWGRNRGYSAV